MKSQDKVLRIRKKLFRAYEGRAEILKALAHPTRLFIVEQLADGERCVCKFVEMIKADFSTVSKHLAVLKQAGIVEDEKRGQQVFYRLRIPCALRFISCIEEVVRANVEEQVEMLR